MRRNRGRPTPDAIRHNAILGALSGQDLDDVLHTGSLIELQLHEQIYAAGELIRTVLFPLDSILSVLVHMRDGTTVEVATIGREGASGSSVFLGGERAANECLCEMPGNAVAIPQGEARRLLSERPIFRDAAQHFLRNYTTVLSQQVACNGLHTIYQRTARWLLLSQDRSGRARIPLTHEYLAMMLGSRRSGVSVALSNLKKTGSIDYGRRYVTVRDRNRLLEAACECYEIAREQYGSAGGEVILSKA